MSKKNEEFDLLLPRSVFVSIFFVLEGNDGTVCSTDSQFMAVISPEYARIFKSAKNNNFTQPVTSISRQLINSIFAGIQGKAGIAPINVSVPKNRDKRAQGKTFNSVLLPSYLRKNTQQQHYPR